MNEHPSDRPSPRPPRPVAAHRGALRPPQPHTAAELARLLHLLRDDGAHAITIGHGRHRASVAAARALAAAWGGPVVDIVHWPASAASWLKPARRLAASQPDAWVIADTPAGWAQVARRLADQPAWTASRTFGFASLASAGLVALADVSMLGGMRGATARGGSWRVETQRRDARRRLCQGSPSQHADYASKWVIV